MLALFRSIELPLKQREKIVDAAVALLASAAAAETMIGVRFSLSSQAVIIVF